MITTASLKSYSHKDLAQMAKQGGVRGWHSMRKDQLVKALLAAKAKAAAAAARSTASRATASRTTAIGRTNGAANGRVNGTVATVTSRNGKKTAVVPAQRPAVPAVAAVRRPTAPVKSVARPVPVKPAAPTRVQRHLSQIRSKLERSKNLASERGTEKGPIKERIVVMVRDAFWLHAYWEVRRTSVERIQAAMSQDWHTARPFLRLLEVHDGGTTTSSERVVKDIEVHGGVSNWYVHVDNSPASYRLELGYLGSSGRFFPLVRSNVVTTPEPGSSDALDENWTAVAQNFDKIYAMSGGYSPDNNSLELQELFEERLRRPMGSPMVTRYGSPTQGLLPSLGDFKFEVDAEMIVYGVTNPDTHVSLRGEPVKIRPDGSFTVRMALPNQRQVIPVVASAANGAEQRTIVLAVERNTKVMEPLVREAND